MTKTIILADDDNAIRKVLNQALTRDNYNVLTTGTASGLWNLVNENHADLIIMDVIMPDENGLDLLPRIKKIRPNLEVIVMSAQNTMMTAVNATQRGAFEYIPKPFDLFDLRNIIARALQKKNIKTHNITDDNIDSEQLPLIGRSQAMQDVYRSLARLMNTDLTVLITGESGTGKELAARALHDYGKRKNFPFIAINMAAIPRELIESELFGHEKGSFTGATNNSKGRFRQAEGGTLFLDEIGDMPSEAQTRLLRVLQEGEFNTVGGSKAIHSDVRIIAATHRDLTQSIRQGLFREDLYYRLNVVPIRMPALKERKEDIPELVKYFLYRSTEEGLPWKKLDERAMNRLKQHDWPGNVRELENFIRRVSALYSQESISIEVIEAELSEFNPIDQDQNSILSNISEVIETLASDCLNLQKDNLEKGDLYNLILKEIERPLISYVLNISRGNQLKCANILGLNRNTLRKKINELNIPVMRTPK